MPRKYEEDSLEYYFKNIEHLPTLTREEELELIKKAQQGDREAVEKLLYANLRYVVAIAKKYKDRGVPLADLINEGNMGLLRAIKRFDLSKNVRFMSYAIWWVKQAILNAISNQAKDIRISHSARTRARELLDIGESLSHEMGALSTVQDIAKEVNLPEREVTELLSHVQREISLEALTREEDSKSHIPEFLVQDALPSPEQALKQEAMKKAVDDALKTLSPRERYIVKRFFGLDEDEPEPLSQIAKRLGISRERARQLKDRALKKLRERFGNTLLKYIRSD